jgi:hypothetical protein
MVCQTMLHSVKETVSWTDMLGLNGNSTPDTSESSESSSATLVSTPKMGSQRMPKAGSPPKSLPRDIASTKNTAEVTSSHNFGELIAYFARNNIKESLPSAYICLT